MRQIASTAFLSISWLTALAYSPSFSQRAEPDIWGEVIMKQPFDSGVFREIRIPKKRSSHVPPGRVEYNIAEYKRLGVRILGVYPPYVPRRGL